MCALFSSMRRRKATRRAGSSCCVQTLTSSSALGLGVPECASSRVQDFDPLEYESNTRGDYCIGGVGDVVFHTYWRKRLGQLIV